MPRHDACFAVYQALRARLMHLLPRLSSRPPIRWMATRRARAQLDAILCHLIEMLDRDDTAAEAIAACITAADLCAIGEAIERARDDVPVLVFRLHHVGLAGIREPHVAFETVDLDAALEDAAVIDGPFERRNGYRVVVIDDAGLPTELIEVGAFGSTISRRHRIGDSTNGTARRHHGVRR